MALIEDKTHDGDNFLTTITELDYRKLFMNDHIEQIVSSYISGQYE
jgi:hypothetical protein